MLVAQEAVLDFCRLEVDLKLVNQILRFPDLGKGQELKMPGVRDKEAYLQWAWRSGIRQGGVIK